jgi:hypothetical protein
MNGASLLLRASPALCVFALACTTPGGSNESRSSTAGHFLRSVLPHSCPLVGCFSGVAFTVHLDDATESVGPDGTFHACVRDKCFDGLFVRAASPSDTRWTCRVPDSFPLALHCDLVPDGTGSVLGFAIIDQPPYTDGDRVSVRVEARGRTLVDHVRTVTYGEHNPNGPDCPPTCRNAVVELWPGAPSNVACGPNACEPTVRWESTLPLTRDGAGHTLVTACKNADCKTVEASAYWLWDDAKNAPVPQMNGIMGTPPVDGSRVQIKVFSTSRPVDAPYHLTFEFTGDTRQYKNGDTYSIDWKSKDGKVLLSEKRVVDAYDERHLGGDGCSPVACKTKDFGGP